MKMQGAGYLAKDPEFKTFESGATMMSFVIPKTEKWTAKDGTKQEKTEWHEFKMNIPADSEKRLNYFKEVMLKGVVVSVEAKQRTEKWEKEGVPQSKIVYMISDLQIFAPSKASVAAADAPTETDKPVVDNSNDDEDGLPF
jgi:single-strand DNA-binding protein